uniref:Uncharacterized protein n=1 Tax=Moniliophthora roreri TaxID=221103 RepID=A0A0W0EWP9_MONRR
MLKEHLVQSHLGKMEITSKGHPLPTDRYNETYEEYLTHKKS